MNEQILAKAQEMIEVAAEANKREAMLKREQAKQNYLQLRGRKSKKRSRR